jgi:hypothetical protein
MEGVVNTLRYYAGWADKIEGRTVPVRGNFLSYTLRQPVGVVGQIIPWNFPLLMLAWKWGPALACGNTVVMKLAEQTPLTGMRVAELAREAGFPDGVINVLNGYGETTGAAIVAHPDIDKIAFTGHYETAKIIQKSAADTLKRWTFELGGKSPNVVFADCDLDRAVEGAHHAIDFHGASAAPRARACSSRRRSTRSSWTGSRRRQRGGSWATRWTRRPSRARRCPVSRWTRSWCTSTSARSRGRSWSPAAGGSATGGSSWNRPSSTGSGTTWPLRGTRSSGRW